MDSFSDYLHHISKKLGVDKKTLLKQIVLLAHERKKSSNEVLSLLKELSEKCY